MRTTAIIPVKRFDSAKRRLVGSLGEKRRRELVEAMLGDVLAAVLKARRIDRVLVVSGEPAAVELAARNGIEVLDDPGDRGHPEAALIGIGRALAEGDDRVVLLPGDCPLLDPREIDRILDRPPLRFAVIVPDRHGTGTNALFLSPPDAIAPAFGEGSRARHEGLARSAGVESVVERLGSLALDLDTPDDLEALTEVLGVDPDRAPRTAAALAA